ncbi:MAG TPA: hypothetical protein VHU88_05945 [Sporichthyaceae bacterium]|jgi:hypothetical protein|nr:hypothetical protein [Sporichthyaceae bacterium]
MRRLLISSLLAGAALIAVPSVGAAAVLADAPPGGPSLPVCLTANVGGLDLNQLCKDSGK